ncbi:MAG: RecX family transcriptional regulator [Treponema sp.]|jgi:regulatory protein|nr:RecX family transcriptional regulator [Treponema sp.]
MTIVSVKPETGGISGEGGADIRRLELSDGSLFSFRLFYLPPHLASGSFYSPGTAEGRELGEGEEDALRFASACYRAERNALRLIARAEQSVSGLARKLERGGHKRACVKAVLARLSGLDAVNDRRFAELWLLSRLGRRTDSPRSLLAALRGRGISGNDAEKSLKKALGGGAEQELLVRYAKKNGLVSSESTLTASDFVWSKLKFEGFSPAAIQRFRDEWET